MTSPARAITARLLGDGYGLRRGRFEAPWLAVAVLLATAGLAFLSPVAPDTWLALVGGRETVRHGLPLHDSLAALTAGRDWVDQVWLSHLAMYGAYTAGGLGGVAVLGRIAATLAGLIALAAAGQRRSSQLACTIALLLGLALLIGRNELRPQLLAEPFFAGLLWLLADDVREQSRRLLWAAPLLLVVWANVHGSVLLGSALVILRIAVSALPQERKRQPFGAQRAAVLVLAALIAPIASPYGFRVTHYYESVLGNDALKQHISEWWPTTPSSAPVAFTGVLLVLALVAWQWRALQPFDTAVLAAMAVGAFTAQRNIAWFALVTIALLPPALDQALPRRVVLARVSGAAGLCLLAAALGLFELTSIARRSDASLAAAFPRSAEPVMTAAARDPRSSVLASPWLADWLLFERPALKGRLVLDGRFELLTAGEIDRYIATLEGHRSPASAYPDARILALDGNPALSARARRQPGARVIEHDPAMTTITLSALPR